MTAHTSTTAYREHVIDGKAGSQRNRVLKALRFFGPRSRAGIVALFEDHGLLAAHPEIDGPPIPLASVCGRVNAMLESGLLRVAKEDIDERTGHRVQYLEAVRPEPKQKSFDGFMP